MKHILLAVSGMTPQIITETLYGIYKKSPEKMPVEIHVITTGKGCERLKNALMGPDNKLKQFCQDYNLPTIQFDESSIHIPKNKKQPIQDVRSEHEQEIIGDFIINYVRELTAHNDIAIHASLAGGRKTMGFSIGYAMSLFGRPQDSLSHVLVNEPYESVNDFFYPTPQEEWRAGRDDQRYDLGKAEVTLATIPLVLMRQEMPTDLISDKKLTYTKTIERINQANKLSKETATINIDYQTLTVNCDGYLVPLKADLFAFYSWIAQDSKNNPGKGIDAPTKSIQVSKLDNRMRNFILSTCHPDLNLVQKSLELPLDELMEKIDDLLDRLCEAQPTLKLRASHLLVDNDNAKFLLDSHSSEHQPGLANKHKLLWDRLLRETNKAFKDKLGKRLAELYQIRTVISSQEDEKNPKARRDYKGLQISKDNITYKELIIE